MIRIEPKNIDAVILCGGLGKRLKSVVNDRPKPMAKVGGRPFLDILIDYVASYGFIRYILCIGYMGDAIKQHYQRGKNSWTVLFSDESKLLGTGGAIKNAEALIQSNPFLVMNGDSFCPVDLCKFIDFHVNKKALLSVVLVNANKAKKDYGVITLGNSYRVVRFDEKAIPRNNTFINAGIYLFDTAILSLIPAHKKFSLEHDLFPRIVSRDFFGYITNENFIDIGTPEKYKEANQLLANA